MFQHLGCKNGYNVKWSKKLLAKNVKMRVWGLNCRSNLSNKMFIHSIVLTGSQLTTKSNFPPTLVLNINPSKYSKSPSMLSFRLDVLNARVVSLTSVTVQEKKTILSSSLINIFQWILNFRQSFSSFVTLS